MSIASEWAKQYQKAREEIADAEMKRPEGAWLKLGPGRTLNVMVGDDGNPMIASPLLIGDSVELGDLCDFARAILRAFSAVDRGGRGRCDVRGARGLRIAHEGGPAAEWARGTEPRHGATEG